MEQLLANISGKTRRGKIGSTEYIVAPVTLIVPGVLNGSQGPLLYPLEELRKDPDAWNNVPLTLGHPTIDQQHVSARDPDVLNSAGLGKVMRANVNGKLIAEAWFDVKETRRIDDRILDRLEKGEPIELSTGLFTDTEPVENGDHEGTSYTGVARNFKPDHLAILMDKVGACSVKDGCGVLVNTLFGMTSQDKGHMHAAQVDKDGFGSTSFEDGHFHSVRRFRVESADGHTHELSEKKLTEINTNSEEKDMNPNVDFLITNCDCWAEEDREVLNGFSDAKLEELKNAVTQSKEREAIFSAATQDFEDKQGNNHVYNEETQKWETKLKEEPKKEEPVVNEKTEPKTTEQWLSEAPAEIQEDLAFARNEKAKQKSQIIDKLLVNIGDDVKKGQIERLQKRPIEELQADLALLPEEKEPLAVNYFGQASPTGNAIPEDDNDDDMELPIVNYAEQSA